MKLLRYIEIDVPEFDETERAALFDAGVYLTRGAGLTGAADSKLLTFSVWLRLSGSGSGLRWLVEDGGSNSNRLVILADHSFEVFGSNAAGTIILQQTTSPLPLGKWVHVLGSVDLADPAKNHLYVDDALDLVPLTFTNDTMDFTETEWAIGAETSGNNPFAGAIADFWYAPGVYIDFSIEANRRKFINDMGNPVSLGATGNLPTGTAPLVFMSGALASWHTNKGTGGGFTENGTLEEAGPVDYTYRFAMPTDYLPREIDAIPSIANINYTPGRISLGENLGERATLSVTLTDHRHIFNGEPFDAGTFWGKWRARYGQRLRGRPIRWIDGLLGQTLAEMETRHFIIESTDGLNTDGTYAIIAKDILKLADNDRAQAPVLSNGFLLANINSSTTSATLSPSGIGNAEYASSGHLAIGGEEIVSFTRSGDALTITRGQLGTPAAAHEAGDRVQTVLRYVGEDPAVIIDDLLVTYAGVDERYIDLADSWLTETETYLQRLYTATISEPTSVNKLVSELIEQAALALWWDPLTQKIRLQVLRAISTEAAIFDHGNTIKGSLKVKEQPDSRISQVWTYFGQRNSLKPVDDPDNYRSVAATANLEAETEYGAAIIKKIFSRWIAFGGRSVALRVNDIQIGRFRDPPRKFNFEVMRRGDDNVVMGGGYRLESWTLQNMDGTPTNAPVQVTRLNPLPDRFQAEAEEALFESFEPDDLADRTIIIDSSIDNVNLRTMHDAIYPTPTGVEDPAVTVHCYIEPSVLIGSTNNNSAFAVGDWPSGINVRVYVRGRIQGRGGAGGKAMGLDGVSQGGFVGRTGLYTRYPITLILNEGAGDVFGGGGGGAGGKVAGFNLGEAGGGGGGSGNRVGTGGAPGNGGNETRGSNGSTFSGGNGGPVVNPGAGPAQTGGNGGAPGASGQSRGGGEFGATVSGGGGGAAIDGISFVTKVGTGDIRGSQIN